MDEAQHQSEADEEKPANGIKGLRHWKYDLLAGLVVSLVSLPLSSGIAIASGAPPIYGILSSVIAGLVFPLVGGSFVTISGPAAGLAPALLATMAALGGAGDADHVGQGYHLLLVVIFFVGVTQLIMAKLKLARFAAIFPASVVEGMLGAIGVLVLVKALPMSVGYLEPVHAHGFAEYVGQLPTIFASANPMATLIAAVGLVAMLAANTEKAREFKVFKVVPPHIWAVLLGIGLSLMVGLEAMDSRFLIDVPDNPLTGFTLPAFGQMWSSPNLWKAALVGLVTLTLIDGVESLATAQAIDRIDPFKRRSEPNRVLAAMGLSNMVSSLVGGLTIIPGGVKSKTCIEAGGRTLWANFGNAVFLLGFLFIAPTLISMIPLATLGAILVFTGWKMVHPSIARHLHHVGREQVALYAVTILVTLFTDLLVGILVGTGLKMGLISFYAWRVSSNSHGQLTFKETLRDMFRDPVTAERRDGERLTLTVGRPLVCLNGFRLQERLAEVPEDVKEVVIHLDIAVAVMDHTTCDAILALAASANRYKVTLKGLEQMKRLSEDERAIHIQEARRFLSHSVAAATAATALTAGDALASVDVPLDLATSTPEATAYESRER